MTIVNAGLPPVLVIAADGAVLSVARCGTPPGLVPAAAYESVTATTERGARIILVSDGLTEPFGSATASLPCAERLGVLQARDAASASALEETSESLDARITASLALADGRQADDATIVVLDRVG